MTARWGWLTQPERAYTPGFALRVTIKAAALFVLANLIFALLDPLPALGRISIYNGLVPGRERLPYGENPAQSYNLSLNSLDAMFSSHSLARPKAADEFRVLVAGDSSVWGILLRPAETLAGQLNTLGLTAPDGRRLVFYNIGHPVMSLTKDLLLLDYARRYQPDAVIWALTLQSFPRDGQLEPPLVQRNRPTVRRLIADYGLALDPDDSPLVRLTFWDETLVGRRRELADWLRLQLYGLSWATTGVDQYYPPEYTPRASDFEADVSWRDLTQPTALDGDILAWEVLAAGIASVEPLPVLLVNEPIFISAGVNSDLRYNFWYPRWAYDAYHAGLTAQAEARGWRLLDAWDAIAPDEFTDSPVHLTPAGSRQLAEQVGAVFEAFLADS